MTESTRLIIQIWLPKFPASNLHWVPKSLRGEFKEPCMTCQAPHDLIQEGLLLSKSSLRPFIPTSLRYLLCPKPVFFLHLDMLPICMEHSPPSTQPLSFTQVVIFHNKHSWLLPCSLSQSPTSTCAFLVRPHLFTQYTIIIAIALFFFISPRNSHLFHQFQSPATISFYKTLPRGKSPVKVTNQDFWAPYLPRLFQGPRKVRCFCTTLKRRH